MPTTFHLFPLLPPEVRLTPNPPQLQVNSEARREALRCYGAYFQTEEMPHACIYLAPERDTVHIHEALLAYLGDVERAALRRMVIEVHDHLLFTSYWMDSLKGMQRLSEIVLVVKPFAPPVAATSWPPVMGDEEIVNGLRESFVEGVRGCLEWSVPLVRIVSEDGKGMGSFQVKWEGEETV
ncbi:hypothetical protein BJX96DRAFT_174173 [Aspergillus floccosus]